MNNVQVAQAYIDAWNIRDADLLMAAFGDGGTYSDPVAGAILSGNAIGAYARGLWESFSDLRFDVVSIADAGADSVAVQWLMRGTNTGPFHGLPPTGRAIVVPGADFIEVEGGKVHSVRGYFDSRAVPEQLGLQVIVQPVAAGPFAFGTSRAVQSGRNVKPGAFSITALYARSEEEADAIRDYSRQTVQDMTSMQGFIGWTGMTVGRHQMTVTAWEHPDHPHQLMQSAAHQEAMRKFFGAELAAGGVISIWVPHHIGAMWMRCTECKRMVDSEKMAGKCPCGATLPEPFPYW